MGSFHRLSILVRILLGEQVEQRLFLVGFAKHSCYILPTFYFLPDIPIKSAIVFPRRGVLANAAPPPLAIICICVAMSGADETLLLLNFKDSFGFGFSLSK